MSADAGDSSDRRFMAYNALGCIICKEGEDYNIIEVALHDTRAQRRRMPNLNDLFRFSIASLGDRVRVSETFLALKASLALLPT